jgi:heme/copper-type cytochrome/quinol oxidase subunit 2
MTTRARVGLIAAVVVIAVVGYIVLKPSSSKHHTASSGDVQVYVKNAKPVGGIKNITVNKGDPVRFTVHSDVSDEIHVHGYNFHKDVKAGGKVSFAFPAKIDGQFVVELEGRGEQIASLRVNP